MQQGSEDRTRSLRMFQVTPTDTQKTGGRSEYGDCKTKLSPRKLNSLTQWLKHTFKFFLEPFFCRRSWTVGSSILYLSSSHTKNKRCIVRDLKVSRWREWGVSSWNITKTLPKPSVLKVRPLPLLETSRKNCPMRQRHTREELILKASTDCF